MKKNRFFRNLDEKLQTKAEVIYPSVVKQKPVKKKKIIIFVGRLSFHAKAHHLPMYMALEKASKKLKKTSQLYMVYFLAFFF